MVKYDVSLSNPEMGGAEKFTVAWKVTSNDGKKVKFKVTSGASGERWADEEDVEIDLLKLSKCRSYKDVIQIALEQEDMPKELKRFMRRVIEDVDFKITAGSTSRATVSVAGSSFNCTVVPYTATVNVGNTSFSVRDIKTWTSRKVPLNGIVKAEWETSFPLFDDDRGRETATAGVTITLSEYSSNR